MFSPEELEILLKMSLNLIKQREDTIRALLEKLSNPEMPQQVEEKKESNVTLTQAL